LPGGGGCCWRNGDVAVAAAALTAAAAIRLFIDDDRSLMLVKSSGWGRERRDREPKRFEITKLILPEPGLLDVELVRFNPLTAAAGVNVAEEHDGMENALLGCFPCGAPLSSPPPPPPLDDGREIACGSFRFLGFAGFTVAVVEVDGDEFKATPL